MDWKAWILEKAMDSIWETILKRGEKGRPKVESNNKPHLIDVIQNENSQNTIFSKSSRQDFNTKSVLVVMPGEEAVFVDNGKIMGVLKPGRHVLATSNYPFLSDISTILTGGKRLYSSSIYFIRKTVSPPVDWGTSIQVRDPVQLISTRVMFHGTYRIEIISSIKFLKYFIGNGAEQLDEKEFSHLLQGEIVQSIKTRLADFIITGNEEILAVSRKQQFIAEQIGLEVEKMFQQYGFRISAFSISGIDLFDPDANRQKIEEAYRDKRINEILN